MKSIKFSLLMIAATFFLSGCSATGSHYKSVDSIPNGKAMVTFYRPKAFSGSGVKLMIVDNGAQIGRIQNGQFIQYSAEAGKHRFHTDTALAIDRVVEFDVEEGKNYYVRTAIRHGMWVNSWYLTRVDEEEALAELIYCCKSGK